MLQINTTALNRYQILNIAGKGGMGRVYHAVDILDGTHWAIKEDLSPEADLQLFEEAEVLKDLDHPALPKTRGVVTWQGKQYMIMQFMEGATLSAMLKSQEKYPEQRVLRWFTQICDVLCYLHSRPKPIVYRDLKPSNIIIDREDNVRIIDFGIAEEYTSQDNSGMHKGGLTKGYAAPEQYSRRFKADVRTDIYALGATIHYLLTGKNPAKPPYEFLPVRKLAKEVSPGMEAVVKRCLQPNPDMRYSTADVLYQDLIHLDQINADLRKKRQKRMIALGLVAAAVVAALLIFQNVVRSGRKQQIEAYSAVVSQSRSAAERGDHEEAAVFAQQAIEMQPNEISGYLAAAYDYMLQGEYDQCRAYVTIEILDRFPDCYEDVEFLTLMAQLCDRSTGPQEGLYYYRQRCVQLPDIPEYWFDLADCLIRCGEYAEAEETLGQYLAAGGDEALYRELAAKLPKD